MKNKIQDKKAIRKCSICGQSFESEGLISCPAHSFGEFNPIMEMEEQKLCSPERGQPHSN